MDVHIPTAAAETVFHIGPLGVTNAMVNGWIAVLFFVVVAFLLKNRNALIPQGLQNVAEAVVALMLDEVEKVTGDRKQAKDFLPIVGTIFLFVLLSNWMGLLPGTGTLTWDHHTLLRPATSDLNLTLAIAVFAVLSSHVIGIMTIGAASHFSKFVNLRGIWRAFSKGPLEVGIAVIEFGVGLIEIVSEVAKVVSLALRLFGNIFAGEVLLSVMLGLFSYFLPVPFMFMELLVGVVQATVFAMLTLAYLVVATSEHGHEEEAHGHDDPQTSVQAAAAHA